jgi:transcriptional regulator with XRE-family HTH domain
METETDGFDLTIGERLKALRLAANMTLDALAAESGVSRAMISRIERAEASPTAVLLARLCTAMGLSLSSFFEGAEEAADPLSRRAAQKVWTDPETGYLRRSVSPPGLGARVDIVEVEFPPGARIFYPPQTAAQSQNQHVWLFEGEMELTVGETVHRLAPGDCLHMNIGQGHAFFNPGKTTARYAVVIDRGLK